MQRRPPLHALQAGRAFLPMTAIILPADLASGWLATRTGAQLPIFVGQILMLVGCAGLLEVSEGTPYWKMTAQLLFIGAGIGLTVPAMTSALLGTVDKSRSGIASGVPNAARQAGSVVGVGIFGTFVTELNHMVAGLRLVLLISAGALLASTLLTFIILGRSAGAHRRLDRPAAVQRAGAIR